MKLSTAAVIIAAGTSNVFSPNVVLAGKAGKLAPKASKAKTAKAHPSLSYGSGSYSMSTGPSPPPPAECPCFDEGDLSTVTPVNVNAAGSNCFGPAESSFYSLEGGINYFEAGVGETGKISCQYVQDGIFDISKIITPAEEVACSELIVMRCDEIQALTTTTSSTTTTTTAAGCAGGWKLNEAYCFTLNEIINPNTCFTFTTCPTSAAIGDTIGELDSNGSTSSIILTSIPSDNKVISIRFGGSSGTFYLSADGTYFNTADGGAGATYSIA